MWYPSRVLVKPTAEPISVLSARRQCGLVADDASRDDEIDIAIQSARAYVERKCAIRLMTQTVQMQCDRWEDLGWLPDAPIQSVSDVTYVPPDGTSVVADSSCYEVFHDDLAPMIAIRPAKAWPARAPGSRITVTAVCGYGAEADVPADIRAAMLVHVGLSVSMSGRDALLRSDSVEGVGEQTWSGIVDVSTQFNASADAILARYQRWPLS